jgi:hypothetical protein
MEVQMLLSLLPFHPYPVDQCLPSVCCHRYPTIATGHCSISILIPLTNPCHLSAAIAIPSPRRASKKQTPDVTKHRRSPDHMLLCMKELLFGLQNLV